MDIELDKKGDSLKIVIDGNIDTDGFLFQPAFFQFDFYFVGHIFGAPHFG